MGLIGRYMMMFGAPAEVADRTDWAYAHVARASLANAMLFAVPFSLLILAARGGGVATFAVAYAVFSSFFFLWIYVAMTLRNRRS